MNDPLMPVKLSKFRIILWVALLATSAFAAWGWLRPYEWNADAAANGKIAGTIVSQDISHYWLTAHVKIDSGKSHDFQKPVRLLSGSGVVLEPADTTVTGDSNQSITEAWFKFWLTREQMAAPLALQINDGKLAIKKSDSAPVIPSGKQKYYTSSDW